MRTLSFVSLILAAALGTFSAWGTQTSAGQRAFDEMAGMVPWFAGLLAIPFFAVATIAWWCSELRDPD